MTPHLYPAPIQSLAALGLAALSILPWSAHAADAKPFNEETARKLAAVAEWRGFFELEWSGTGSGSSETMPLSRGSADCRSFGTIILRRGAKRDGWDPAEGSFVWRGQAEATFSAQSAYSSRSSNGEETEWRAEARGPAKLDWTELTIWMSSSFAKFHWGGGGATQDQVTVQRTGHHLALGSGDRLNRIPINERQTISAYLPNHHQTDRGGERQNVDWWPQVAGGPGPIAITTQVTDAGALGLDWFALPMRNRVLLYPVYDDLECEVTIPGYADWLPRGNLTNDQLPGNGLAAQAVLKSKDGKDQNLPEVDHFRFELIDTSREPGVCLNWPLGAVDREPDFKLAAAAGLPGKLGEEDQSLEIPGALKDAQGRPTASARVQCFDFGARAELRVTCILKDGRKIVGLIKGADGQPDLVRLPKRAPGGWIAEAWRRDQKVMDLGEFDDDEQVAGQPMHGDGFTLYEEYRGWVVAGEHRQGDPRRKDFFVLNQRGADARAGISLFEKLSRLRVHSTLRDGDEMTAGFRVMNANHRDGPHREPQFGVVIARTPNDRGGLTNWAVGADHDHAMRPKTAGEIIMEVSEAGAGTALFSVQTGMQDFHLTLRDAEFRLSRSFAHELMHTVGVSHHGYSKDDVTEVKCAFQGPATPANPTGAPRYASQDDIDRNDGRVSTITILWENNDKDVFQDKLADYAKALQTSMAFFTTGDGRSWPDARVEEAKLASAGLAVPRFEAAWTADDWRKVLADEQAAAALAQTILVAPSNDLHSGHDRCVMKYAFANAYRIANRNNAYYFTRPGSMVAGREICRSSAGTDTNASTHPPQSRFGDAADGLGDCFPQICPNDAIPPRLTTPRRKK